jgi:hypothetical protein
MAVCYLYKGISLTMTLEWYIEVWRLSGGENLSYSGLS